MAKPFFWQHGTINWCSADPRRLKDKNYFQFCFAFWGRNNIQTEVNLSPNSVWKNHTDTYTYGKYNATYIQNFLFIVFFQFIWTSLLYHFNFTSKNKPQVTPTPILYQLPPIKQDGKCNETSFPVIICRQTNPISNDVQLPLNFF